MVQIAKRYFILGKGVCGGGKIIKKEREKKGRGAMEGGTEKEKENIVTSNGNYLIFSLN